MGVAHRSANRRLAWLAAGVCTLALQLVAASVSAQTAAAGVTVLVKAIGAERDRGRSYAVAVQCRDERGNARAEYVANVKAGTERTVGSEEIPGLLPNDDCYVRVDPVEGGQVRYATSGARRSDGTPAEPVPGVLDKGVYRSADGRASEVAFVVTVSFGGDLVLSASIESRSTQVLRTPTISAVLQCEGDSVGRTLVLADGQLRILTGISAGSVCRVSVAGGARFVDNSGDPNDGKVTIVNTPASCWDLRNVDPACRASIAISGVASDPALDVASTTISSTTTTSAPDRQEDQRAAATAAPSAAPSAAPATPVAEAVAGETAFTG